MIVSESRIIFRKYFLDRLASMRLFLATMTRLKQKREALRLTQARVAMLAGITERTLQSHELGKGRKCPWPAREALARVLGVPLETLFTHDGIAR